MATYLKRTSKLFDISLSRASGDVSLRDLMCPVCRGILIEPVTLPCTHNLCLRCLKGTFEHNSLSCPLCRVRVGSWLRTATKSETLVNSGLWELIRANFPKEVEDKHNGDDRDLDLDTGYTAANKILSAAGEIRQEYEAQLQRVEEERRCQIEAEQMASEALIRKLQAEEHQEQLMLLAQDQLFAKTLAKKQVTEKQNESPANYGKFPNASLPQCALENKKYNVNAHIDVGASKLDQDTDNGKVDLLDIRDASEVRRPNIALISKIRTGGLKRSLRKELTIKFCCQKPMPVYNAVTKTFTQQSAAKVVQPCTSNYITEPGPSVSKIYGKQSKEELHVPNDIVSNKKKSLGIEVCVTSGEGDSRIGSAESAGSHDSINQEIHHFKPIKAIPRTPLKISTDGRQVDTKLIRVVPILKRISNAVPKPPLQTHFKRIIGCSWSAFRGKTKQNSREKEVLHKSAELIDLAQKASTSCEEVQISEDTLTKLCDSNQRVDFVADVSYDTNKNYTKSENKIVNGVKVGKRLNAEAQMGIEKSPHKGGLRKTHIKNGMVGKSRRQRNAYGSRKGTKSVAEEKDSENSDTRASVSPESLSKLHPEDDEDNEEPTGRSKRRKTQVHKRTIDETDNLSINSEPNYRRTTRKRAGGIIDVVTQETKTKLEKSKVQAELNKAAVVKSKRRRTCRSTRNNAEDSSNSADSSKSENENVAGTSLRKSARNAKHTNKTDDLEQSISNQELAYCRENFFHQSAVQLKDPSKSSKLNTLEKTTRSPHITDEDAIMDQERIEQALQQEKEDFELAQRLQAKFDEMTRIAGRTRQSRRVIGSPNFELDLWKMDLERTASKPASASTTTQPIYNQTVHTEVRKRGRPPKRVK